MTPSDLQIAVLAGSTRPKRRALTVAEWICAEHLDGLELVLVDLDAMDLPMLAEPSPAAFGGYALAHTREWSRLIDGFDGYVLVSPEYNIGFSCSRLSLSSLSSRSFDGGVWTYEGSDHQLADAVRAGHGAKARG